MVKPRQNLPGLHRRDIKRRIKGKDGGFDLSSWDALPSEKQRRHHWRLGPLRLWATQFDNHTIVGFGWVGRHGWEFEFMG